jgi:hypothetical protein
VVRTLEEHSLIQDTEVDQECKLSQDNEDGEEDQEAHAPGHSSISSSDDLVCLRSLKVEMANTHKRTNREEEQMRFPASDEFG